MTVSRITVRSFVQLSTIRDQISYKNKLSGIAPAVQNFARSPAPGVFFSSSCYIGASSWFWILGRGRALLYLNRMGTHELPLPSALEGRRSLLFDRVEVGSICGAAERQ